MAIDDHQIANELIPASSKRARSYHSELGGKTVSELEQLASQGGDIGNRAKQMLKLQVKKPMRNFAHEIRQLLQEERYDEALRRLEAPEIEQARQAGILNPELLVLKGICIQMSDDVSKYELSDVETLNRQALALDGNCVEAWIELGYYYYALMNDAKNADVAFKNALSQLRDTATEAVIGQLKAASELETSEDAERQLDNTLEQLIDINKVHSELGDLKANKLHS